MQPKVQKVAISATKAKAPTPVVSAKKQSNYLAQVKKRMKTKRKRSSLRARDPSRTKKPSIEDIAKVNTTNCRRSQ